jgi:hypothetical protein
MTGKPLQFNLRKVFWATTLVAIGCGFPYWRTQYQAWRREAKLAEPDEARARWFSLFGEQCEEKERAERRIEELMRELKL